MRAKYGFNEIRERRESFLRKLGKKLLSPITLMFIAAGALTLAAQRMFDFYLIIVLMLINIGVALWQEEKADHAIATLRSHLLVKVKILRGASWQWEESRMLVPGDVIELAMGDLVPADAEFLEAQNVTVNEAALTGESLPQEKTAGAKGFSGSFLATGRAVARVAAIGANTTFGKTLFLIDKSSRRSALEKDILSISKLLSIMSFIVIGALTVVFVSWHAPVGDVLLVDISLLIAGIPISLPTVMTIIVGLGVLELAKKNAVVRRLSSLEDLANVNLLFTDKTGTLTKNEIAVARILAYGEYREEDAVRFALYAALDGDRSQIDRAIMEKAAALGVGKEDAPVSDIPADSDRKRSTAVIDREGRHIAVSLGAPQVIASLCRLASAEASRFAADVAAAAKDGYRSLAVAVNNMGPKEENMSLAGMFMISDTLRSDAKNIIDFMEENGIGVKMVTGDNEAISTRVAGELGLAGAVVARGSFSGMEETAMNREWFARYGAFSEVLPIDKYRLVTAAKSFATVAVTGDGVNDLPAIKAADVGIAVQNAVDALKSAADMVLLSKGISVIKDAVLEARKTFARLYSYSLYRISESSRLIITIAVLGFLYGRYPLSALELIILALLNDIPIISLAFDRVHAPQKPAKVNARERFILSILFGLSGVANSLILFFLMADVFHLPWAAIETMYFLKLTVSGHMLIYVAHTKERWFKFLPSKQVIWATSLTQLLASLMAGFGIVVAKIPVSYILIVWGWSFAWMQVSELMKDVMRRVTRYGGEASNL